MTDFSEIVSGRSSPIIEASLDYGGGKKRAIGVKKGKKLANVKSKPT